MEAMNKGSGVCVAAELPPVTRVEPHEARIGWLSSKKLIKATKCLQQLTHGHLKNMDHNDEEAKQASSPVTENEVQGTERSVQ